MKVAGDRKKRAEARQLERQCLFKQLSRVFHRLNTFVVAADASGLDLTAFTINSVGGTPTTKTGDGFTTPFTHTSSTAGSVAAALTPRRLSTSSLYSTAPNPVSMAAGAALPLHTASGCLPPGWVRISSQLDGFDRNSCTALTTQAELLELEAHSLRAAYDTSLEHIAAMRRNNLSEEVIAVLQSSKVAEFKAIYESVLKNKDMHVNFWMAYTDAQEHIIRRQINAENAYFNAKNTANKLTQLLAVKLLQIRTADETAGEGYYTEPFVLNIMPDESEGE